MAPVVTLTRGHQCPPEIRQLSPRRDWMDQTYRKHAYKCLPVTSANVHGWELLLQQDVVVQWDGEGTVPRCLSGEYITHHLSDTTEIAGRIWGNSSYDRLMVEQSTIQMVSFNVDWVIQTPPNYAVWMSGPPNYFVDGAEAMSVIVPGWWPDPVQFNWRINKPNVPITFPKGMPYMSFKIIEMDLLSNVEFKVENAWNKPEIMQERSEYCLSKTAKEEEEPWSWMGGIRTAVNAEGCPMSTGIADPEFGIPFESHPVLEVPEQ